MKRKIGRLQRNGRMRESVHYKSALWFWSRLNYSENYENQEEGKKIFGEPLKEDQIKDVLDVNAASKNDETSTDVHESDSNYGCSWDETSTSDSNYSYSQQDDSLSTNFLDDDILDESSSLDEQ